MRGRIELAGGCADGHGLADADLAGGGRGDRARTAPPDPWVDLPSTRRVCSDPPDRSAALPGGAPAHHPPCSDCQPARPSPCASPAGALTSGTPRAAATARPGVADL